MGIAHKIYTALGGKKGSFLQQKWSNYCKKKDLKRKQALLKKYGLEALQAFKDACMECQKDYWLEFGTLLGAYREKSFIPHDFDLDVGMPAEDYTNTFEQALISKGFVKDHSFDLLDVPNNKRTPSEHAFFYKDLAIDIFLAIPHETSRSTYCYSVGEKNAITATRAFTFEKNDSLSKVSINGVELCAPANPAENLAAYYGEDFMTPNPNCTGNKNKNPHLTHYSPSEYTGVLIRVSKNVQ